MRKILGMWLALALLTACPALAAPELSGDMAKEIVESLLAAAAGTTYDDEQNLRAERTEEEALAHSAALAAHRAQTLPWLCASLGQAAMDARTLEECYAAMQACEAGRAYLELMEGCGFEGARACLEGGAQAFRVWLEDIDAAALERINPDYACWLYCPDSPIDYPVVQGADNSVYLHRLFNGERNACGTLFIDARNLPNFQDPNTLIYGHHMRDGSMFKSLTRYEDQAWYDSHPYMLLVSGRERAVLELFASCTTSKRDACYDVALSDADDLRAFAVELRGKSDFISSVEIEPGDRLVTLSTCAYAFESARRIVVGRILSAWDSEEAM